MYANTLRKLSVVLLIVGALALIIGLGAFAGSTAARNSVWAINLPGLAGHYEKVQFGVLTGGSVAVTFATDVPVTIYVFTDAQHTAFLATGVAQALSQATGMSGAFSTNLPAGGTYFIEITHASGYDSNATTGTINVGITGIDPALFGGGVISLAIGVVLIIIGIYFQRLARKRASAPAWPPYAAAGPYAGAPPSPYPIPPYGGSGTPPPGSWGPVPPGTLPASAAPPVVGAPQAAPGTGMILITVENRAAADETVQLLVNGAPSVSLTVPAGKAVQASLRALVDSRAGTTVILEAVTGDGRRTSQSVYVTAGATAAVALRIG